MCGSGSGMCRTTGRGGIGLCRCCNVDTVALSVSGTAYSIGIVNRRGPVGGSIVGLAVLSGMNNATVSGPVSVGAAGVDGLGSMMLGCGGGVNGAGSFAVVIPMGIACA